MTQETTPEITAEVIDAAFESNDPEVRKLPLNSPDLNAALEDSGKTDSDDGDDDDAPAGDDENEQENASKKKPRARDRRIDQLTAKIGELQRSLEQRQEAPKERAPEPKFQPTVEKPKIQDFNSLEDYTEKMTEWKLEAREQERENTAKIRELEKQSAVVRDTWQSKEKEVVKEYTDYNDVVTVQSLSTLGPSNEARLYLGECDDGPRVLYTLLNDAEQAEKFASASPVKQVAMLAKLEAQFGDSTGSDVKKNIATRAPEPPRHLPSGKTASVARNVLTNAHEMSFEEFDRQVTQYERNKKRR